MGWNMKDGLMIILPKLPPGADPIYSTNQVAGMGNRPEEAEEPTIFSTLT